MRLNTQVEAKSLSPVCTILLSVRMLEQSRGHWLGPGFMEVAGSGLLLLTWAFSLRGLWLGPVPADVADLGLLLGLDPVLQSSLVQACSLGSCCLIPAPMEVTGLGLVPQRPLA